MINNAKKRLKKIQKIVSLQFHKHQSKVLAITTTLFVTFLVGSFFTQTTESQETTDQEQPLSVGVLDLNQSTASQEVSASVKNLSTLTLVAQTAGPVNKVYVSEGQSIKRGSWVATQESAYVAGNGASIQRQIAETNLEQAEKSLETTANIVSKNREIADKNRDNTEQLRKISADSIDSTRSLLDLTNTVVDQLKSDIETAPDEATKQTLRQQLISLQANLNQTESSLKNLEYSTSTDNPPTGLADAGKDLVYQTTELQLQSAETQKHIAELSLKAARINEAIYRVASPISGQVERVHVTKGQYITPGTPVATIKGNLDMQIIGNVSGQTAQLIDDMSPIEIMVSGETDQLHEYHLSSAPTNGQLFQVIAKVPQHLESTLQEGQTITLKLPITTTNYQETTEYYLPLEALFITNTNRFVYILDKDTNTAIKRIVDTGPIIGSQILIQSGITSEDIIIVDRRVTENQLVTVISQSDEN